MVRSLPAIQETEEVWLRSLGQGDPLEEEMAAHSSVLAWRIPVDRGAWRAAARGVTQSQMQLSKRTQAIQILQN